MTRSISPNETEEYTVYEISRPIPFYTYEVGIETLWGFSTHSWAPIYLIKIEIRIC